jgi:hypothetical protein
MSRPPLVSSPSAPNITAGRTTRAETRFDKNHFPKSQESILLYKQMMIEKYEAEMAQNNRSASVPTTQQERFAHQVKTSNIKQEDPNDSSDEKMRLNWLAQLSTFRLDPRFEF